MCLKPKPRFMNYSCKCLKKPGFSFLVLPIDYFKNFFLYLIFEMENANGNLYKCLKHISTSGSMKRHKRMFSM